MCAHVCLPFKTLLRESVTHQRLRITNVVALNPILCVSHYELLSLGRLLAYLRAFIHKVLLAWTKGKLKTWEPGLMHVGVFFFSDFKF